MKIEKLEVSNRKNKLMFILGALFTLVLVILINYFTSRANYRNTQSIDLAKGTINYKAPDFNVIAMYIIEDGEDVEIKDVPIIGYKLSERSYCSIPDSEVQIKDNLSYKKGIVDISINKKGTKCYLYFEKYIFPSEKTLMKLGIDANIAGIVEDFSKTACDDGTNKYGVDYNCESNDKGLFKASEGEGLSYYYRGTVNNNWVKFGNYWWRIIRINENGTVRMIYSGKTNSGTQPTEDGKWAPYDNVFLSDRISFNGEYSNENSFNDNTYVGFKYGSARASSYLEAHSNKNDSTVLSTLKEWYNSDNSMNKELIDGSTGFCNDRTPYPYDDFTLESKPDRVKYGFSQVKTKYGPYYRTYISHIPTFDCPQENDIFTEENIGIPVGLITADEVVYAGGRMASNTGYWLYTGNSNQWTMSPYRSNWNNSDKLWPSMYIINISGSLTDEYTSAKGAVRPVINLKASTNFLGTGIIGDPYIPS